MVPKYVEVMINYFIFCLDFMIGFYQQPPDTLTHLTDTPKLLIDKFSRQLNCGYEWVQYFQILLF